MVLLLPRGNLALQKKKKKKKPQQSLYNDDYVDLVEKENEWNRKSTKTPKDTQKLNEYFLNKLGL